MVIRRFGVWSVAKLYAAIAGTFGLIIGLIIAAASTVGAGLPRSADGTSPFPMAFLGFGAIVAVPLCYAVLGLISGAIGAALYNLFAGMVGGIDLEIQQ